MDTVRNRGNQQSWFINWQTEQGHESRQHQWQFGFKQLF
ncbi:hypothetical protein HNQ59_000244 [Chitinivorax tropicus]|uniref:Uncharacterized protein n=1 Tax=Chitinivorax tropicus TaxID=714531 RepID=A0A840MJV7_9PROT|nr:hypothetical protein [Chitinivorax tropicus]